MKTIFIALPCYGGKVEAELMLWGMAQAASHRFRLITKPVRNLYIEHTRNLSVVWARQDRADYLLMVDADTEPHPDFLPQAVALLEGLRQMGKVGVVGAPYLAASNETTVWEYRQGVSNKVTTDEAAARVGFEEVLNLGTGCLLMDMRVFDRMKQPYFRVIYDEAMEEINRTEDVDFCNKVRVEAGAHVFVAWDCWANHYKGQVLRKPEAVRPLPPPDVQGLSTDMGTVYEAAVSAAADGAHFVEVGCWKGASTIMLAKMIRASGKRIQITAVDTFTGSPDEDYHRREVERCGGSLRAAFDANLRKHGVEGLVEVKQMDSVCAARAFAAESLDFVFIDAQHGYDAVHQDIRAWLPLVKPGATLAGHDVDWPGVRRAVTELLPGAKMVPPRSWAWRKPLAEREDADAEQFQEIA